MKIDLHCHTHFSDGKLSVPELMMRAQQMQVDVLAITDHDSVDAIVPALDYIEQHKMNIKLLSGVEISTRWHGFEIHILGLDLDHTQELLQQRLALQIEKRELRAQKICAKLAKIGIENVFEDAYKKAVSGQGKACISRAHIAQVLVDRGLCSHLQQAFSHYLGQNKKAYVVPEWISIEESIQWVHDAGGKAIIAHPFHYTMTTKWLRRLATEFAQAGGDGMEVQHPNLALKKHQLMLEIAKESALSISTGSDFHAPSKWTELGRRTITTSMQSLIDSQQVEAVWQNFELALSKEGPNSSKISASF